MLSSAQDKMMEKDFGQQQKAKRIRLLGNTLVSMSPTKRNSKYYTRFYMEVSAQLIRSPKIQS